MLYLALPVLKIVGLVLTAFFALVELFRGKTTEARAGRGRRWGIVAISASLVVAMAAETLGAALNIREATQAAASAAASAAKTERIVRDLDRSLHPLLPIQVEADFRADLEGPLFAPYRARLVAAAPRSDDGFWPELTAQSRLFPSARSENPAYALLNAFPQATIFLLRGSGDVTRLPDSAIGLSCQLRATRTNLVPVTGGAADRRIGKPRRVAERLYGFSRSGKVFMHFPPDTIHASDCYSNGEVIAMPDLLGATLVVEVHPYFSVMAVGESDPASAIEQALDLEMLDVTFPGFREIQVSRDRGLQTVTPHRRYSFRFPATKQELERLFVP